MKEKMRELKFRAWTRHEKKMYDVWKLHWVLDKIYIDIQGRSDIEIETDLMQYTGLKDKQGKEIYIGDILTAQYPGSDGTLCKNSVVWDDDEAGVSFATCPLWIWEDVKIIGNIHENPDLL